jgi:hypothetical protein
MLSFLRRLFGQAGPPAGYGQEHLQCVQAIHQRDLADGHGRVELPHVLARKYPNANREWGWQFVFPQERRWQNATTGQQGRPPADRTTRSRLTWDF